MQGPDSHGDRSQHGEPDHVPDEERLTAALVDMHQQLVGDTELETTCDGRAMLREFAPENVPVDEAEFEDLARCLEQLERTRRYAADRANSPGGASTEQRPADGVIADQCIGRFEIIRELGRGGLGVVLLARDPVLRRQVALKIPNPEVVVSPSLRRRFHREGHAAARLQHPHIVSVYEVGEVGPICFIAAAYVDGPTLATWLAARREPCTPRMAAALVADLADAMHYAHGQNVLHRDLKPSNVLIETETHGHPPDDQRTRQVTAKIADFGLAKLTDQGDDETRHGMVLGTPAYMSPEQARGDLAAVGPASDVYSLGAILYEMLTGQTPYQAESDASLLVQLLDLTEPVPVRRLQPQVSADLAAICRCCLEKPPAARYGSAGELAADLRRYLAGEPTKARNLSALQRAVRWAQRRPALAALAVVSLAALVTLAVGAGFYARDLNSALSLARHNATEAETNREEATRQEARANEQLYAAEMQLTNLALQDGNRERAHALLDKYGPESRFAKLRGIEWYVLESQVARMDNDGEQSATTILEHPCEMLSAAMLHDERLVVTGGRDGDLRIWEHATNKVVHRIPAHASCINHIRLSVDGRQMATASCDYTVIVWRVPESGVPEPIRHLEHTEQVRLVAWSPDGARLACIASVHESDRRGHIYVWDLASGGVIHSEPADIGNLLWSPDGRYVVVAGPSHLRALRTSDWQPQFDKVTQRSVGMAFHWAGALWISEHRVGLCTLDMETGDSSLVLRDDAREHLVWDPACTVLATVDGESIVRAYASGEVYHEVVFNQRHSGRIHDALVSPNGRYLVTAGLDCRVDVTELTKRLGQAPTSTLLHGEGLWRNVQQIDTDGRHVTLTDDQHHVYRLQVDWDPDCIRCEPEVTTEKTRLIPRAEVRALPSKRRVEQTAAGSLIVRYLDEERTESLATMLAGELRESWVFDRPNLAVVLSAARMLVVDLATGEIRYDVTDDSYEAPPHYGGHSAALSTDGRWLTITTVHGGLRLLDIVENRSLELLAGNDPMKEINGLSISPDRRRVAVIDGHANVYVWEIPSGRRLHRLRVERFASSLAFSPDGRTLGIGSDEGLQLWHTETGQQMVKVRIQDGVRTVQFSEDGRTLYCASTDGTAAELYRWQVE